MQKRRPITHRLVVLFPEQIFCRPQETVCVPIKKHLPPQEARGYNILVPSQALTDYSWRDNVVGKRNDTALPRDRRERKYRRFSGNFPVQLKCRFRNSVSEMQAVTNNVSVGGFLLQTVSPIPYHAHVSFLMTLHGGTVIRPLQVVGEGKVVRVEPHDSGAGFAVAVKCKRPMSQIRQNLTGLATLKK